MRYHSVNQFFKNSFGQKVYKLALDGGFTCPNRDGTLSDKGCVFCLEGSGHFSEKTCDDINLAFEKAKNRVKAKTDASLFAAYFQSYTNTYAPVQRLKNLFAPLCERNDVAALFIATRPDCLEDEKINLLCSLNEKKPVFIELGLQTIHEKTAEYIRRGYPLCVYDDCVKRLKSHGLNVITHVILGLPGEDKKMMIETVKHVCDVKSDGIKLQLLHVLEGTDLACDWQKGLFQTLSLEQYADILCDCVEVLSPEVVVHRLTGDAPKKFLLSPMWSADKKRVLNEINRSFELRDVVQGKNFTKKTQRP